MVVGLLISAFLLLVGGSFIIYLASSILQWALTGLVHIAFFVVGALIVWKFILPRFDKVIKTRSTRDDKALLISGSIAVGLFLLGVPGLVFSVGTSAHEAAQGQGFILSVGGSVFPDFPLLGFALVGLIALIAIGVMTKKIQIRL